MAKQYKDSYSTRQELVGLITDQRKPRFQGERQTVQKKTFTRWINIHLAKCDPPIEVLDLFKDIQDGRILLALLEQLSGCKLLYRFRPASHHIFKLNNISKALTFLDDRHVKLVSIDASCIADGSPAAVLALIWNIILFFQIKEVTRGLHKLSSSLTSLSINSYPSFGDLSPPPCEIIPSPFKTLPSKGKRAAKTPKYNGKAINILLHWVQICTSKFGIEVCDFSKSWMSGLVFLALIKSIDPGLVDLWECLPREPKENVEEAFRIAEHRLGIPRLLEPEDVTSSPPDEQSVITYVSQFLQHYHDLDEDAASDFGSSADFSIDSSTSQLPNPSASSCQHSVARLPSLEKNNRAWLWTKWETCASNGTQTAVYHLPESNTSAPTITTNMSATCLTQSPSPRTCPGNVTEEQALGETCMDERNFSLSSNEGVYTLLALDSDEEDAYSYILGLNKDLPDPFESQDLDQHRVCGAQETEREIRPESNPRGRLDGDAERGLQLREVSGVQTKGFEQGCAEGLNSKDPEHIPTHSKDGESDGDNQPAACMVPYLEGLQLKTEDKTDRGRVTKERRKLKGSARQKLLTEGFVGEEEEEEEDKEGLNIMAVYVFEDDMQSERRQECEGVQTGFEEAEDAIKRHAWEEGKGVRREEWEEGKGVRREEWNEEKEDLIHNGNNWEEKMGSEGMANNDVEREEKGVTGDPECCERKNEEIGPADVEVKEGKMENDVFREGGIKMTELVVEFRQRFGIEQHNKPVITEVTLEKYDGETDEEEEEKEEKIENCVEKDATKEVHLSELTLAEGAEEMDTHHIHQQPDNASLRQKSSANTDKTKIALGVLPDCLAPTSGITRSEQDVMLVLWILLYCYFVLPQVNFL